MHGVDLFRPMQARDVEGAETYDGDEWDHEKNRYLCTNIAESFRSRCQIYIEDTVVAADLFAPQSVDFVFADADHTTSGLLADIKAWYPKIKWGGFFLGDDIDWPSVRKAVEETGFDYQEGPDSIWWYQI
jgi:hypothetical protein